MKKNGLCIAALLSVLLLGLTHGLTASADDSSTAVVVNIEGSSFSPGVITVKAGDEVVWKNKDAATHTVTADDGSFDSGALGQGDQFRRKFPSAGTFKYSCDNHAWMRGAVIVR